MIPRYSLPEMSAVFAEETRLRVEYARHAHVVRHRLRAAPQRRLIDRRAPCRRCSPACRCTQTSAGRGREGEKRYRAHLHNGSYPALVALGDTLDDAATCLLCFEASHEECHRAVIVDALEDRLGDLDVVHLQ